MVTKVVDRFMRGLLEGKIPLAEFALRTVARREKEQVEMAAFVIDSLVPQVGMEDSFQPRETPLVAYLGELLGEKRFHHDGEKGNGDYTFTADLSGNEPPYTRVECVFKGNRLVSFTKNTDYKGSAPSTDIIDIVNDSTGPIQQKNTERVGGTTIHEEVITLGKVGNRLALQKEVTVTDVVSRSKWPDKLVLGVSVIKGDPELRRRFYMQMPHIFARFQDTIGVLAEQGKFVPKVPNER